MYHCLHTCTHLYVGEYMSKTWEHFEEVSKHLWYVNHAHIPKMKDLLIYEIGELWESWGLPEGLQTFWNGNMQGVWDAWSIGEFECMLATPSQQVCIHSSYARA